MPFWSTLTVVERWQVIHYIKTFNEDFKRKETPSVVSIGAEASSNSESAERGKKLFKDAKCFLCHGEDGRADGPITTTLKGEMGPSL